MAAARMSLSQGKYSRWESGFPAGAGGGAQPGFAWAADGEKVRSISVLSVLGALSLNLSQVSARRSKCALHLWAFKLLGRFTPRELQLPSPTFCLHKVWSYSSLIFQLIGLKKKRKSRHQLIHKIQVRTRRCHSWSKFPHCFHQDRAADSPALTVLSSFCRSCSEAATSSGWF